MGRNFPCDTPNAVAQIKQRSQDEKFIKNLRDPAYIKRWFDQVGNEAADQIEHRERQLAAIITWLEANQPDVFKRGLWDAIP